MKLFLSFHNFDGERVWCDVWSHDFDQNIYNTTEPKFIQKIEVDFDDTNILELPERTTRDYLTVTPPNIEQIIPLAIEHFKEFCTFKPTEEVTNG